jgi:hypothetical protein
MYGLKTLLPLAFILATTAALPTIEERAATTCGSNSYTANQVNAAAQKSCSYHNSGTTAGSSTYPHTYNNYEGFDFPVAGPYLEFPLLASGSVYTGGLSSSDSPFYVSRI